MKKIAFFLCAAFFGISLTAQITFETTIGNIDDDGGISIAECSDGGFIISGYTENYYSGYRNIYVVRLNQYGDTLWTHTEGDTYQYCSANSACQTFDQGFIVTGYIDTDEDMPFLLKLNSNGAKEWIKIYSSFLAKGSGRSVIKTTDSSFVFCGTAESDKSSDKLWNQQVFVAKINNQGEVIWNKTLGNSGVHYAVDVIETSDSNYVVAGMFDTPGEYHDAWAFKVHKTGITLWNKTYGTDNSLDSFQSVDETSDGGLIFCGTTYQGIIAMNGDVYLVKTNANGNEEWSKTIGGSHDIGGVSVCNTSDNELIIGAESDDYGNGDYDILLIKTDIQGDSLWTRFHGGPLTEYVRSLITTNDGGFAFTGYTRSYGVGGSDVYVVKTNADGLLTSIDDTRNLPHVTISPNPSSGLFSVTSNEPINGFTVYDLNGKIVSEQTFQDNNLKFFNINLQDKPDGLFCITIKSGGNYHSFKVIKKQ